MGLKEYYEETERMQGEILSRMCSCGGINCILIESITKVCYSPCSRDDKFPVTIRAFCKECGKDHTERFWA